ncbi:hypothetical protein MMC21_007978 [Puttea exsequens]|nr:hypothetical protein [Puttea exsequens]
MIPQTRLLLGLLSYNAFTSLTLAASPTSFCKCTCFSNSTIIPLDAPSPATQRPQQLFVARHAENDELEEPLPEDPPSNTGLPVAAPGENGGGRIWDEKGDDEDRVEFRRGNCNDCNRQYCDELHLPICTGANLEDIFTTCFRMSPLVLTRENETRPRVIGLT